MKRGRVTILQLTTFGCGIRSHAANQSFVLSRCQAPEVIVEYAYDHISEWYLQWVDSQELPGKDALRGSWRGCNPRLLSQTLNVVLEFLS